MFGYIQIHAQQMRVWEYQFYKSLYCGLCRSQGKCTGQCSRMTLSYDFVYMAAVRMALDGTELSFDRRTCVRHPFRKTPYLCANPQISYCAFAAGLLNGQKCRDDKQDSRGFSALRAAFRYAAVRPSEKRAEKKYPELAKKLSDTMEKIRQVEKDPSAGADAHAQLCGEMLGLLFAEGFTGESASLAYRIGVRTGRLADWLDALDDLEKDKKNGSYNPILVLYPDAGGKDADMIENVRTVLFEELMALESLFDLLPFETEKGIKAVLDNIIHVGLPRVIGKLLDGGHSDTNQEKEAVRR